MTGERPGDDGAPPSPGHDAAGGEAEGVEPGEAEGAGTAPAEGAEPGEAEGLEPGAAEGLEPGAAAPRGQPAAAAPTPASADARPVHRSPARVVRDLAEAVLVAILIVVFATTFTVQNSVIPSASMVETLLVGDYILVDKVAFAPEDADRPAAWLGMREIRHADVVVFKYPEDPSTDYIKRVIGLQGDVIEVRNKAVLRNGVKLDEPWAVHRTGVVHPRGSRDGARDNFGPVRVPPGMLFVMGDNRDYSRDSREFGFVPRSHVTGRAFIVFWSRSAPPGTYRHRGPVLSRIVASVRRFHRDVRWDRIFTLIR